jgi:hypothetical protein
VKLHLYIFFLSLSLGIYAQGFKVAHYLPGVKTHLSKAIFETTPGNYITGGIVVDSINGVYCNRLCIMGLGNQGQILWIKKYGNNKFQYLNNPFISRSFYKQGNYVYYTTCVLDSMNKYIGILLKLNQSGDTIWQKTYRDSDPLEDIIPQMVTGSVDGGFLVTGFFQNNSATPYNRCMLIKTDANGIELWRKKIGKINPDVNDGKNIIQDSVSKKIVVTGYQYFSGNSIHDNVVIVDSLGNQAQRYNYMNPLGGVLLDMIQTQDKKIVAVGYKYHPQISGGNIKSFIVKFDFNTPSFPLWTIDFDKLSVTNAFSCLIELGNGDVMVGGALDTIRLTSPLENDLTRLIRISPNGIIKSKWYYNYKVNSPMYDNMQGLRSIHSTSDGGLVGAIECFNFPNPNPFFFVKWDSLGCDSTLGYCQAVAMTVEKNYSRITDISIYPNPGQGLYYLSVPEAEASRELWLSVADLSGRIVKHMAVEQSKQRLDLKELRSGVYIVTVSDQKKTLYTAKLIKQD